MDRAQLGSRIAALQRECAALARDLAAHGRALEPGECFEVAGELQGLVNAAEGAQGVAAAFGARVETTLTSAGPVERTHPVGFVDAMAATEMSLATGLTEGVAGRKVALGAALGERFPQLRDRVLDGQVAAVTAHKVIDACAGLDLEACGRVDAQLAARLAGMDPARVTSAARQVAARVAADQVAAHAARTRRGRTVQVRAGEDGLSEWWVLLPTATSAAAVSAVDALAGQYRQLDDTLTVPESRADAFGDLLLRNVQVTAKVTLGVPVLTGHTGTHPHPASVASASTPVGSGATVRVERDVEDTIVDADTGEVIRIGDLHPDSREDFRWVELDADVEQEDRPGRFGVPMAAVRPGFAVSGTHLAGLGWVEPATLAGLLRTVPMDIARAVLDAETGTQLEHRTDTYRPPQALRDFVTTRDGTCRMWGCTRPADRCDLDHTRPWPTGATTPTNLVALCRRHHRMKQRGRWHPTLTDDGNLTWTDPTGHARTTEPDHRLEPNTPTPHTPSSTATPRATATPPPATLTSSPATPTPTHPTAPAEDLIPF